MTDSPYMPGRTETVLNAAWCKPGECKRTDCLSFCEKAWDAVQKQMASKDRKEAEQ